MLDEKDEGREGWKKVHVLIYKTQLSIYMY